MTFTHALATNNYGEAKFIVSSNAYEGTHTTLATAMAAASSGDTIFLRTSVTENVTITPGVNIAAWSGGSLNTPSITGTLTMTGAGTSTISGIELITNSAAIISITGSAASILNVYNCYLNCSNNTGITFSTSSGSAQLNLFFCYGNIGTTGISLFTHSSGGILNIDHCNITNTGSSTTVSTASAGSLNVLSSNLFVAITTSSTNAFAAIFSQFAPGVNAVTLTCGGSGGNSATYCSFISGTSSAISVGATLNLRSCSVSSSNTNAITGAGTVNYEGLFFSNGNSVVINTTTQVGGTIQGGVAQAPSAGFLGERFTAATTVGSPANNTPTSLVSINLTSGIWDISALANFVFTGASTITLLNISPTNNAIVGNSGDAYSTTQIGLATASTIGLSVPAFRVTLTSNATYYAVVQANFSTGAVTVTGRISAVRVG